MTLLESKLKKIFGNYSGAILTGSQVNNIQLNPISDVDVIVFVTDISLNYSFKLVDGYRFDFLVMPLFNIDLALINEYFDNRAVVLNMIASGRVIKDTASSFISDIKRQAIEVYNKKKKDVFREGEIIIRDLTRIKDLTNQKLIKIELFLFLNEFGSKALQLYYLKEYNVMPQTIKHTIKNLKNDHGTFVDQLDRLITDISNNKKVVNNINGFIDNLISDYYSGVNTYQYQRERVLLDLFYEKISIEHFVLELLPKLLQDTYFKGKFVYFFISNRALNRVFKNFITIVLAPNDETEPDINIYLNNLLNKHNLTGINISIIPTHYFDKAISISSLFILLEPVCIQLSVLVAKKVTKEIEYVLNDFIIYSCFISGFLASKLELDLSNLNLINKHLLNKWILNPSDQLNSRKGGTDSKTLYSAKISTYDQFYDQNKQDVILSISSSIKQAKELEPTASSYHFLTALNDLIENPILHGEIVKMFPLSNRLNKTFLTSQVDKILIYQIVLENLLFNILDRQEAIAEVVHIVSKGISFLSGESKH